MMDEKEVGFLGQPPASLKDERNVRQKGMPGRSFVLTLMVAALMWLYLPNAVSMFSSTAVKEFDNLHWSKLCPDLSLIETSEFEARRSELGRLLKGPDGQSWGAYVSEPGPNTLYYLNITSKDWHLSERPWLMAITPDNHLSILTPAFELSRSKLLPLAVSESTRAKISWIPWQEAEDPYDLLLSNLSGLRSQAGQGEWTIHLEENVRQLVASGLEEAASGLTSGIKPNVQLAALQLREQRMRKTKAELALQRCAGKVTLHALRAVRQKLYYGMTEKEGEELIIKALTAGGLTSLEYIALFGSNAALPHASASSTKTLKRGEFALFDVGGNLGGYQSDFTRTMLPDSRRFRCSRHTGEHGEWPNARAKKVWETVQKAQMAALDALMNQEGQAVKAMNVDKAAREVIVAEEWGKYFTHRLGHGIGLETHEAPYLNSGNPQTLLSGETFSNEPGIYIERSVDPEGDGIGVRLEDMVLKTEDGWELVSGEPLARSPWDP